MGFKMRSLTRGKINPDQMHRFIQGLTQVLRSQLSFEAPYSNDEFCQETLNPAQSTLSFMIALTGFL